MSVNLSLGEKLSDLREAKGVKQSDVGRFIGASESTVSSYESDHRKPSIDILKKIAEYYGVSSDYLLGIDNNPYSHHVLSNRFVISDKGKTITADMLLKQFDELSSEHKLAVLRIMDMLVDKKAFNVSHLIEMIAKLV